MGHFAADQLHEADQALHLPHRSLDSIAGPLVGHFENDPPLPVRARKSSLGAVMPNLLWKCGVEVEVMRIARLSARKMEGDHASLGAPFDQINANLHAVGDRRFAAPGIERTYSRQRRWCRPL